MFPDIRLEHQGALDLMESIERLPLFVDAEVYAAFWRAGNVVAERAKQQHGYRDRSGELTGSIEPIDPSGSVMRNTLVGGAKATAPYAEFLEGNPEFSFLGPALEASQDEISQLLDESLERAIVRSGL